MGSATGAGPLLAAESVRRTLTFLGWGQGDLAGEQVFGCDNGPLAAPVHPTAPPSRKSLTVLPDLR